MKRLVLGMACGLLALSSVLVFDARGAQQSGFSFPGARVSDVIDVDGQVIGHVAIAPGDGDGEVGGVLLVEGLTPGEHGVHLHAVGDCDPAGEKPFDSAGSHFNPGNMHHGQHSGDLGNLPVDDSGAAAFSFGSSTWTLDDGLFGLGDTDGTALVIHEQTDDLVTDPSGNSGARIACAVLVPPAS